MPTMSSTAFPKLQTISFSLSVSPTLSSAPNSRCVEKATESLTKLERSLLCGIAKELEGKRKSLSMLVWSANVRSQCLPTFARGTMAKKLREKRQTAGQWRNSEANPRGTKRRRMLTQEEVKSQ